jgi:hypothetical protein
MDLLPRLIFFVLMHFGVEVENMHQPRLLTGENRTYFSFEETKLPRVD